jgi:predicted nucleic-acid-binding protein
MRAVDTNICVRVLVRDDERQFERAKAILAEPFILLPTVLIEVFWVLRSNYQLDRKTINERMTRLLGNERASIVAEESVAWAMEQFRQGADFADALHVALASDAGAITFATFEKQLTKLEHASLQIEIAI